MSANIYMDGETVELADAIARRLGSTRERTIKMALTLMAVDVAIRFELPRKEKEDGG